MTVIQSLGHVISLILVDPYLFLIHFP
jgi:hypothetical protein